MYYTPTAISQLAGEVHCRMRTSVSSRIRQIYCFMLLLILFFGNKLNFSKIQCPLGISEVTPCSRCETVWNINAHESLSIPPLTQKRCSVCTHERESVLAKWYTE